MLLIQLNSFAMKRWKVCILLMAFVCGGIHVSYSQQNKKDSLLHLIETVKNDTLRIKALRDLGYLYTRSASETAKRYFNMAVNLGNKINEHYYTASTYNQLCILYANLAQFDSASYFLNEAKEHTQLGKNNGKAWMDYYQAEGLYHKYKGEYKLALASNNHGVQQARKSLSEEDEAGFYINIGNIYKESGDLQEAISNQLNALKLFEKLNNKLGMAYCYQNIGNIFIKLKRYEDAFKYLQMAAPLKAEMGDKKATASLLQGMGLTTFGMGKYTNAIEYAKQAAINYQDLSLRKNVAEAHLLLSKIYRATGNQILAKNYLKLASEESNSLDDEGLLETVAAERLKFDSVKKLSGDSLATLINLQSSLEKSAERGDNSRMANNYMALSLYYARHKDFEKAYENLEKYHSLENNMTGNEVQLQIKELETRYQVEKKEKQILLLQNDKVLDAARMQEQRFYMIGAFLLSVLIAAISFLLVNRYRIIQRSKRLLEMEKIRNHIARDLHDDIGSTLSSIQLMGSVALKNSKDGKSAKEYLEKIVDNSKKMSAGMKDIVWAINPVNDGFDKMVLRMKEYAAERLEPLDITYDFYLGEKASAVKLPLQQRRDLFMMYKEIINNAVKYSYCDMMHIDFVLRQQHLKLTVTDNGRGFDLENYTSGNGLHNMRERASQMNAQFNINSEIDKGTTVKLSIPIT